MLVGKSRAFVWRGVCCCCAASGHQTPRLVLRPVYVATRALSFNSFIPSSWFSSPSVSNSLLNADEFSEIDHIPGVLSAAGEEIVVKLADLGLGNLYWPSGWVQRLLDMMHNEMGLEWWQAIAALSVMMNTAFLPLSIQWRHPRSRGNIWAGLEAARCAIPARLRPSDEERMMAIIIPSYAVLAVSYFFGIRGMATGPVPGWKAGGILWFPDLTVPDPALAIISGITITVGLRILAGESVVWKKYVQYIGQGLITTAFIYFQPSALGLFWCCSNIYSISVTLICAKSSIVRRVVGFEKYKGSQPEEQNDKTSKKIRNEDREAFRAARKGNKIKDIKKKK